MSNDIIELTVKASGVNLLSELAGGMVNVGKEVGKLPSILSVAEGSFAKFGLAVNGAKALVDGFKGIAGKLTEGNAAFEGYNVQFTTMIKNSSDFKAKYKDVTDPLELQAKASQEATDHMKVLADFGASTPFDLPGVVEADKVLMGFGLTADNTKSRFGFNAAEIRGIAGDLASGTGQSFKDMSLILGKFSAGATGEAISRLQELGVTTRTELTGMGLQFSKSGELIIKNQADMDKATGILMGAIKGKYGGLMTAQSSTLSGMMSNFSDFIDGTIRQVTKPLFEPLKAGLASFLNFVASDAGKAAIQHLVDDVQNGVDFISKAFTIVHDAVITFKAALSGQWVDSEGINGFVAKMGELGLLISNFVAKNDLVTKFEEYGSTFFRVAGALSPLVTAFAVFQGFMEGGVNGAVDALQGRIVNLGNAFGVDLSNVLPTVIDFIQNNLIPAFNTISNIVTNNVIPAISTFANFFVNNVIPAVQKFGDFVVQFLTPIFSSIVDMMVVTVIPALGRLGEFIVTKVMPDIGKLVDWISANLIPTLLKISDFIASTLIPMFGNLVAFIIDSVLPVLLHIVEVVGTILQPILKVLADFIGNTVVPALSTIGDFINTNLIPALSKFWGFIDQNIMPILKVLADVIGNALATALSAMFTMWGKIADILIGAVKLAMDGIKGAINFVIDAVNLLIDGVNLLGGAFGVHIDKIAHADDAQKNLKKSTDDLTNSYNNAAGGVRATVKALDDFIGKAKDAANVPPPKSGGGGSTANYDEGTDYHFGGDAMIAEDGGSEILKLPDGNSFFITKPTFFPNLPRGAQVIGSKETADMMNNARTANDISYINQRLAQGFPSGSQSSNKQIALSSGIGQVVIQTNGNDSNGAIDYDVIARVISDALDRNNRALREDIINTIQGS